MTEHEHAVAFADSIACHRYPHSGAIDAHGATLVEGRTSETWRVGEHLVKFDAQGVSLVCPVACTRARGFGPQRARGARDATGPALPSSRP